MSSEYNYEYLRTIIKCYSIIMHEQEYCRRKPEKNKAKYESYPGRVGFKNWLNSGLYKLS